MEKEPQNAQHLPPERRVDQMIMQLKKHRPMFILVVLPTDNSNAALYGTHLHPHFVLQCIEILISDMTDAIQCGELWQFSSSDSVRRRLGWSLSV